MKNLFTLIFCFFAAITFAQDVSGVLTDESGEPLIGASVVFQGTDIGTITDYDGSFSLSGDGSSDVLELSYIGYATKYINLDGRSNIGTITLSEGGIGLEEIVVTGTMDIVKDRRTPVAVSTITSAEIQAKAVGNVEFPEIMKNTPNVYVSNQTGFGDSQMFTRGFNQSNTAFLLNGQPINGMEDGKMYWSNWSGMSDIANAVQVQRGLGSSKLAISSVGGTINIVTKTIDNEKGGFVRGMIGNDSYFKGTVAYNTGLSESGFAMSILVDHWQGENKWAEGTWGSGQNYFLSLGYKPNDNHTFNFLVTGAPQSHGQRWSQSLNKLRQNPKYNQHWGFYKGDKISERFNYYHKPILNLSWDWDITDDISLASVAYASFGRGGGTGPFGNDKEFRVTTGEGAYKYNDFDAIANGNVDRANEKMIGSYGNALGRRASVNNHQWFGNVTKLDFNLTDKVSASIGSDFRWYAGDHFRHMVNFFGLKGWSDSYRRFKDADGKSVPQVVDQKFEANPWSALYDFADESQRVAYDYSENINYQGGFGQVEYAGERITVFAQGAVSNQSYQREGRWATKGEKSKKYNKLGYNIKGGASLSLNNNNIVFANAGYYSRQPFLDNIFENVRYSNKLIATGIDNEQILGYELGYKFFKNDFSANFNAYHTTWGNRTFSNSFNNDNGTPSNDKDDFVQQNLYRGVEQTHMGLELDTKWVVNDNLTLKGYATYGDWVFNNIDAVDSFNDDTGEKLTNSASIPDVDGVHVKNAPQSTLGLGLGYRFDSGLSFDLDFNHFRRLYKNDINYKENAFRQLTDAGTIDPYTVVDFGIGQRIELSDDNALTLRLNVRNLFDTFYINQTDVYGYVNGNGRTWNVSAKYSF